MAAAGYNRSIPDIFADLVVHLTTLVRKESQLARAEVSEKVSRAAAGMALVMIGAVLVIPALVVLLMAAAAALAEGLGIAPHWSALLVGGSVLLIGLVLLLVGRSQLSAKRLMPNRTIHQLQQDASMAKDTHISTESHEDRHELRRAA